MTSGDTPPETNEEPPLSDEERFAQEIRRECVLAMPLRKLTRVGDDRFFVDWGKHSLIGIPGGGRIMQDGDISVVAFDRKQDGVLLPDSAKLKFGKKSFTIMVWFRTGSGRDPMRLIGNGMDEWSRGYVLGMGRLIGGQVHFGVGGGNVGSSALIATRETYNDRAWHHVAAVYEHKKYMAIYMNGKAALLRKWEKRGTTVGTVDGRRLRLKHRDTPNPDGKLRTVVGNIDESPNGTRQWRGRMRDLAIWRRALSAEEIEKAFEYSRTGESYTKILGGKSPKKP